MKDRKLYRSSSNQLVAGVLSGLAEYFNQDPLLWRLGFLVFLLLTGFMPGVLIYALFWIIVPEAPTIEPVDPTDYTVFN